MEHDNINHEMNKCGTQILEDPILSSSTHDSNLILGEEEYHHNQHQKRKSTNNGFVINDIKLMADEVSGIINSMETYMSIQRRRRLQKLKPPSRLSRNWYIAAIALPITGYVAYKLADGNLGGRLAAEVYEKICSFFTEHVSEPLVSM